VYFSYVAKKYPFSGGDIKNAVLNAARFAANDSENKEKKIFMRHIEGGCRTVAEGKEINRPTKSAKELGYFG
jgi:hypothetical protein